MKEQRLATKPKLTGLTISEYLPFIKKLYAELEVQILSPECDLEKTDRLFMDYLRDDFGITNLLHILDICGMWLQESPFGVQHYKFFRKDHDIPWSKMLGIIFSKISEHANQVPIICMTLSSNGEIVREIYGTKLSRAFKKGSLKVDILSFLAKESDYVPVKKIQESIKSRSSFSIRKIIFNINQETENDLSLPATQPLIINHRGSGFRINPIYNIVLI